MCAIGIGCPALLYETEAVIVEGLKSACPCYVTTVVGL